MKSLKEKPKKTKSQYIFETESALESSRKKIEVRKEDLKKSYDSSDIRRSSFNRMNNFLLHRIIELYTHRTQWDKPQFWFEYLAGNYTQELHEGFYNSLITEFFMKFYTLLYFEVEIVITSYLVQESRKQEIKSFQGLHLPGKYHLLADSLDLYSKEMEDGLKVLRYVRNSAHNNYVFNDKAIPKSVTLRFCGTSYTFTKGEHTQGSYHFVSSIPEQLYVLLDKLAKIYEKDDFIASWQD